MLIRCPKCNVSYDIGAAAIPADGKKVRCSQCGEVWICMPADLFEQPQPEPPAPETEEPPVPETPAAEETGEAETPQEEPVPAGKSEMQEIFAASKPRPKAFLNMRKICRRI